MLPDNQSQQREIPMLPANDHDLLIVLHTLLNRALSDIERLSDGMSARLTDLEKTKADKDEIQIIKADADKLLEDHEKRIRRVERWGFTAIGALAIIELVLKLSGH